MSSIMESIRSSHSVLPPARRNLTILHELVMQISAMSSSRALIFAALISSLFTFAVLGAEFAGRARVIDGDTIELAGRRIRIWGIDAPELPSEPGVAAKGYLQYLMLGQEVHCEGRLLDRYRRLVAVCFLPSGEDIARLMVRAGHAVDWLRYSGGYYAR